VTTPPDITFIFDIDPVIAEKRIAQRSDNNYMDTRSLDFHQRIRDGFLTIAKAHPERCHIIDASQDQDTIFNALIMLIQAYHTDFSLQQAQ
jgi:dTMP kinase